MTERKRKHVIAIASIGGHWVQLLRLIPAFEDFDVTFITNNKNFENTVSGYNFLVVPDANRKSKLQLIKCACTLAWIIFIKVRPKIIITTGAAPGLIAIALGKLMLAKTIWIDSLANADELSLSGKIALKFADRVYTQWEHLSTKNIIYCGNVL